MTRLNLAAAGDAEQNINLINPRFQAEALRQLRGIDCGILDNSFYDSGNKDGLARTPNASFMWPLTATNAQSITIGRGMATAYGYDLQNERNVILNASTPSVGSKYVFIYLEWDLSVTGAANGSILLHDNGSGATWTPPYQDNLITNPIGKYQMPLYRLEIDTTGAIVSTKNWEELGVITIGNVLRSQYTGLADDTKRIAGLNADSDGESLNIAGWQVCKRKEILSDWTFQTFDVDVTSGQTISSATISEELTEGDEVEIVYDPFYTASSGVQPFIVKAIVGPLIGFSSGIGFKASLLHLSNYTGIGFLCTGEVYKVEGTTITCIQSADQDSDGANHNYQRNVVIKKIYKLSY